VADQLGIGGQLGNYVIDSVIGRGGMSVVYRARHSRLGMWVALKVLAPELGSDDAFRERFLREAQMAATVDHPNVIPIHDMGVHESSLYIVMRYVSGGDLKSLMTSTGLLDPQETLTLLGPVAMALDAAHAGGLVHRDVKPANILIQRSSAGEVEHVYLTDFGIAKSEAFLTGLTGTGVFIGTIEYMAPEQMESRDVSPQTDVYALAATFYQCLTARVPFQRELAEGIRPPRGELEPVTGIRPELPVQIDEVLAKALSRNPADRYRTCDQLLRACRYALEGQAAPVGEEAFASTRLSAEDSAAAVGEPVAAGDADEQAQAGSSGAGGSSRRRWAVAGAVVAAAAIAGVAVAVLGSGSKKKPTGPASNAQLQPVPTNRVTGSGQVTVTLKGDVATVTLTTSDLDEDAQLVHAMHIHGGGRGECPPASVAKPHNGHLAIDTNDGIAYYGPPVQALTTSGDTSVASILAFPRYPTGGNLRYSRTIDLPAKVVEYIRENNAVVVVHGINYDKSGIYDGVLDRSDLDKALPATATAPALCGPLVGPQQAASTNPKATVTYTASLDRPTVVTAAEALYCHAPIALADTRRHGGAKPPARSTQATA
jgi:Protein kinase domain